MDPFTPSCSHESNQNAAQTRQLDPESPSNFYQRTPKRVQKDLNIQALSRISLGSNTRTSKLVSSAINAELEKGQRLLHQRISVWKRLARVLDSFCDQEALETRSYAEDLCREFLTFSHTALPTLAGSTKTNTRTLTSSHHLTGHAETLKNSGARARAASASRLAESSDKAPRNYSAAVKRAPPPAALAPRAHKASTPKVDQDKRLLVAITPEARLNRDESFALRRELCHKLKGLTLDQVPRISPTVTGWAIHTNDLSTRDMLNAQENKGTLTEIFRATSITLPTKWYNYAVQGTPTAIPSLVGGSIPITQELVHKEATSQTGAQPANCRQSRHGADASTGLVTWIVSFLAPVRSFALFGGKSQAKLISKSPKLTRHDPGCQDYCNPAHCGKRARCGHCSVPTDEHEGAWGSNCTASSRCANCHGPFPASNDRCPAAPKRINGKTIRVTKAQLASIRKHCSSSTQRQEPTSETDGAKDRPNTSAGSQPSSSSTTPQVILKRRRGEAITEYEQAKSTPTATASRRPARVTT
jgi:hypothetical protein